VGQAVSPRLTVLLGFALLLLATILVTWPMPASLGTVVVGHVNHPGLQGDLFFQWNISRQMEEGSVDYLRTPYLRYPEGQEFRPKVIFSLHLALYSMFMLAADVLTARNLTVLLVLFLNGAAAWLLLWDRFRNAAFAHAGALLFAFGPFVHLKLDQGFVQKAVLFHLPFFVLFFLRMLERRRVLDAVWSGVFLVLSLLVYPPFAVFNGMIGVALLVASGFRRVASRRLALQLGVLGLVALPCVVLVWALGRDDFVMVHQLHLNLDKFWSQGGYLDLLHPFRCYPYLGTFPGRPTQIFVVQLPLGLPLVPLVLAVVGAAARRRYAGWLLAFGLAATLLMAGPYLTASGELVRVGGRPVPLPLLLLDRLPFGQAFRFPIRIFPWLQVALLLAAGEGIAWLTAKTSASSRGARAATVLPILAAAFIVLEPWLIFPEYRRLRIEELERPAYCSDDLVRGSSAVLHLPYFPPGIHEYELQAVLCNTAIVNSYERKAPPIDIPAPDAGSSQKRSFVRLLADSGIGSVVVHPAYFDDLGRKRKAREPSLGRSKGRFTGRDVEAWLEELLGAPKLYLEDGVLLYGVPSDLALTGAEEGHPRKLEAAEQDPLQLGQGSKRKEGSKKRPRVKIEPVVDGLEDL